MSRSSDILCIAAVYSSSLILPVSVNTVKNHFNKGAFITLVFENI